MSDWIEYGTLPHTPVAALVINYCTKTIFAGTHGRSIFSAPIPTVTYSTCNYYCNPETSTSTATQKFNTVKILDSNNNEIFNNNTTTNNDVYQDYSNQTINLTKGKTYTLSTTINTLDSSSHGAALIDYNNDLDWVDTGETIGDFQGSSTTSNNVTKNITFTVPLTATNSLSKLRLRLLSGGQTIPNPCLLNGGQNGNTQDYKVIFSDEPTYCTPLVSGNPNEKITQVRILNAGGNEIFKYNSDAISVLYQDTTNQNITLEKGMSYSLETTISSFFAKSHLSAYIDFNNNLKWDASYELIGNIQSIGTTESNIIKIINFTVPENAISTTSSRLRIRFLFDGILIPNPCNLSGGGFAGETEDYNVTISNSLGLSENEFSSKVEAYPNPTNNMLYIKGVQTDNINYKLIDLSGRTVINTSKYENGIPVSKIAKGTYLLILNNNDVKTVKRIIVK